MRSGGSAWAPLCAALAALLLPALPACSGAERADGASASDPPGLPGSSADGGSRAADGGPGQRARNRLPLPSWMTVDEDGRSVVIALVAGATGANDGWNFNGHSHGDATIVVPEGFEVTIDFSNEDPATVHSVAVLAGPAFPVTFDDPAPAFEGAITSGATSTADGTKTGESESISFTASSPGEFAIACLIPAHAATGMWMGFEVSASGEPGLRR